MAAPKMIAQQDPVARLAQDLEILGADRTEAALVGYLLLEGDATTAHLIKRTKLRQPEVSVGMRALVDRGWVEQRSIGQRSKGRPMHHYTLTQPRGAVLAHYEGAAKRTVESIHAALLRIRQTLRESDPQAPDTIRSGNQGQRT